MEILTSRLRLRPLSITDLEALVDMYADPEVMVGSSGEALARSRQESTEWLEHALSTSGPAAGFETFRVEERDGGAFLGRCGLRPDRRSPNAELAYAFARRAWGRGIATEAARATIAWGAAAGLTRIVGCVLASNRASQRVLAKVGMVLVADEPTAVGSLLRYQMSLPRTRLSGTTGAREGIASDRDARTTGPRTRWSL